MATHYLGRTTNGRIVSRKSTRSDYTHAAIGQGVSGLPNFSTSALAAAKLFESNWRTPPAYEVVAVEKVDAKAYRAALKDAA